MSGFHARYPWKVEWIDLSSGIHSDKQFEERKTAEEYYADCLADRDFLESVHSVSLQWVDFRSPNVHFVYTLKAYRNYPENEGRVRE